MTVIEEKKGDSDRKISLRRLGVAGYVMETKTTSLTGKVTTEYTTIRAELASPDGINPSGRSDQMVNLGPSRGPFTHTGVVAKVIITSKSADLVYHQEKQYLDRSHTRGRSNINGKPIAIFCR